MTTDNTPWARWARKTCTILLWTLGMGIAAVLGMFLWSLLGDETSVRRFYGQPGHLNLAGKPIDLSKVNDVGQIRLVVILMMAGIVGSLGVSFLVLSRIRRLLDVVLAGRPFSPQTVSDLKLIGTVLLFCSAALPLFINLMEAITGAMGTGLARNYQILPDLTFLICGFLVRTLAVIFEHGLVLQEETDLTV